MYLYTIQRLYQQGMEHLVQHLSYIFRACLAYGYIPMALRQVRVMFIPKPKKPDYTKAKAYHPISQSSFLFETLERLADRHIRVGGFKAYPLNQNQYTYRTGKSTETALHDVTV
jgi:hypothetical protein